jgi:hypothetical protein
MGSQENIDTRALEKAMEALVKIDSHEKVCSERYKEIASGQKAIFHKLDEVSSNSNKMNTNNFNRWLVVSGALIMILISIVGYLFSHGGGVIG